jgi:hypothetical protein
MGRVIAILVLASSSVEADVRLDAVLQIGGSQVESVAGMARDASGNLYIAGKTYSFDFPANVGQTRPGGSTLWRVDAGAPPAPLYGQVSRVLAVAADPLQLFVLTDRGLLRSSDCGESCPSSSPPAPWRSTLRTYTSRWPTRACTRAATGAPVGRAAANSVSIGGSTAEVMGSETGSLPGIAGELTMLKARLPALTLREAAVIVKASGINNRPAVGMEVKPQ